MGVRVGGVDADQVGFASLPIERVHCDTYLAGVGVYKISCEAVANVVEQCWLVQVVEPCHVLHSIFRQHVDQQQFLQCCKK